MRRSRARAADRVILCGMRRRSSSPVLRRVRRRRSRPRVALARRPHRRHRRRRPDRGPRRQRPPQRPRPATTCSSAARATTCSPATPGATGCSGGPGADTLLGGGGSDRINGGGGRDIVVGGRRQRRRSTSATAAPTVSRAAPGSDRVRADARRQHRRRLRARPSGDADAAAAARSSCSSTTTRRSAARVAAGLELEGFEVVPRVRRPRGARGASRRSRPPSIVLDLAMPDLDGLEVLRAAARARATTSRSASSPRATRSTTASRPAGRRRRLRRQAVRARGGRRAAARAAAPPARADAATARGRRPRRRPAPPHTRRRGGRDLELTRREFELLALFVRHPGQVLDRAAAARGGLGLHVRPRHQRGRRLRRLPAPQARGRRRAARPAHRARRRLRPATLSAVRSLRGRLTLGVTLVLAGGAGASPALLARARRRPRRARTRSTTGCERTAELVRRATALAAVAAGAAVGDQRLDAVLRRPRTSLRLTLGDTALLETGDPAPRARPPARRGCRDVQRRRRDTTARTSTTLRDPSLGGLARLEVTTRLAALEQRAGAACAAASLLLGLLALLLAAASARGSSPTLVLRPLRRLRAGAPSASPATRTSSAACRPTTARPRLRSLAARFNAMLARLGRSAADRERALEPRGASPPTPATSCARR